MTTTAPKVSLQDWATTQFKTPPHVNTLRRWAREGRITPTPVLVGREYMVEPTATYTPKDPK